MSTLDEITKEKQRVSAALARVDEQREKLTSQLGELDATERVLARYSKGRPARKTAAAKTPTTATKAAAPVQARGRSRTATARAAGGKRSSASLSDQVLALAAGNHRIMQGCSPEPCWRRDCPAQAGRPHRRARR